MPKAYDKNDATTAPAATKKLTALPGSGLLLEIPAPGAKIAELRYRSLEARDQIDLDNPSSSWGQQPLTQHPHKEGYWYCLLNFKTLGLADGTYEYEFLVDGEAVADPYATELEKFGGYRSVWHVKNGERATPEFSWENEYPDIAQVPNNNQMVIYELPVHWMRGDQGRQVGLGTFEQMVFERLLELRNLGINCIELLPIQDSPDTLNWGYGTRFFLAPDWDMGSMLDMKFLVKTCHRMGMRVIMDVVMNHSKECPLETLAHDWFYLKDEEEKERPRWGGQAFRYSTQVNGASPAREFHYHMAEYWVREYHIDGFRIDEFKGIDNWDFIQEFRKRAWAENERIFPNRPFIVIAEDSWRRAEITQDNAHNDQKVVDAAWNFDFRDELRRLLSHTMYTNWGESSRRQRIEAMLSGRQLWNDWDRRFRDHGFSDLGQAINYVTSHDVADYNGQRLMNYFFGQLLQYRGLAGYPSPKDSECQAKGIRIIKALLADITKQNQEIQATHADALERSGSAFALMLTSAGIPMLLAGEELGDIHDLDYANYNRKMSDPVDYSRIEIFGHRTLWNRTRELTRLRTSHPALQRNEIEFFYFHPTLDNNDGEKVFAFCRTNGQPLGSKDQVIVFANCGPQNYPVFNFRNFPYTAGKGIVLKEHGVPNGALSHQIIYDNGWVLSLSLAPFQVRVFST